MGVTGLWTVVQPAARPIKIETLNRKRLAVDASIWIYQFLKAVRDKEGNALRNSHVVGFFRRICKLLFFGIKPVFVFDGGAPALKRQTIAGRKKRREGRREDAVRTAGKLLALQMQRRAEEEERKRKEARRQPRAEDEEEQLPDELVYAEEVHMAPKERQQTRKFRKTDAYHLPDLDVSLAEMSGPNDPRIMSLEELQSYARQFDSGEDINVYDFSKIDFDSVFFQSLPASDRYNILNAARLRSRLRMGYSKEQLDTMFPDRMAFSKFQIERVKERNELTQRLMHLNGMVEDQFGVGGRVAGEKGREYVLVKNDGVEGGWALGVVTSRDEGQRSKPINVDEKEPKPEDEDDSWEDDEFEDVPIEGLNRLPKSKPDSSHRSNPANELVKRRQAFYASRKGFNRQSRPSRPVAQDPDSLFLEQEDGEAADGDKAGDNIDELFEDQQIERVDEEEEDLQRAIQMSLENVQPQQSQPSDEEEEDEFEEVFLQSKAEAAKPFAGGSGLAIARMANARSTKAAAAKPQPFTASDTEDDDVDLQAALTESRISKRKTSPPRRRIEGPREALPAPSIQPPQKSKTSSNAPGFDGPLPFEKLDLGSSLLGKKKMKQTEEDMSGGFERDLTDHKKKPPADLPPWFAGERDIEAEIRARKAQEKAQREKEEQKRIQEEKSFIFNEPTLRRHHTHEVIDLEASQTNQSQEIISIESSDEDEAQDVAPVDNELRLGDLADKVRAEPPKPVEEAVNAAEAVKASGKTANSSPPNNVPFTEDSDDELLEWEASDYEDNTVAAARQQQLEPAGGIIQTTPSPAESESEFEDVPMARPKSPVHVNEPAPAKSVSPEFEDVPIARSKSPAVAKERSPEPLDEELANLPDEEDETIPAPASGLANQDQVLIDLDSDEELYSDPEDAQLFQQLADEAEEHARFASSLNNHESTPATTAQGIAEYERELKQLRSQQKKDRRDADEVTQTMITECQQLLALFGLPYVTAPMEAEAQCAELVKLGLVDGIVTDDSDCFLFGGTRVYKNMFNAAKFVECYLLSDLESSFSLTRHKLIQAALLLGSDYTEGLPGIGPVTALEILSEFGDLREFARWWADVQSGQRPAAADADNAFRRKFRKTHAAKLFLPPGFPDPRVEQAYLEPEVDKDPSPFQWGVPDLGALRKFLMSTIGWGPDRTDEVLVPVIRDMNRREKEGTQSNITRFFDGGVGVGAAGAAGPADGRRAHKGSQRMVRALGKLAGKVPDGEKASGRAEQGKAAASKRATGGKRKKAAEAERSADGTEEDGDAEHEEPKRKARRGTRTERNPSSRTRQSAAARAPEET